MEFNVKSRKEYNKKEEIRGYKLEIRLFKTYCYQHNINLFIQPDARNT
jgi:hypothetical protein